MSSKENWMRVHMMLANKSYEAPWLICLNIQSSSQMRSEGCKLHDSRFLKPKITSILGFWASPGCS